MPISPRSGDPDRLWPKGERRDQGQADEASEKFYSLFAVSVSYVF